MAPIHTCVFRHPQENLPKTRRSPEAEFAERFAHAYQKRFSDVHSGSSRRRTLFVREVPVHGSGIADLLVLSWSEGRLMDLSLGGISATMRAFEVKMGNWRRGVMQAYRYRNFSHAAILVVPKGRLKFVRAHLGLFQSLQVGLWGFDVASRRISTVYTPRPQRERIARYGARAFSAATQAASA